jgi:uncharacterized repeat protein (TIGR01451 family)
LNIYRHIVTTDIFNISEVLKISARKNIFLPVVIIFSLFTSTNIFAAAGDSISSTATVTYDIGGVPGASNASATFIEDRRVNFLVTDSNGGSAVPVISDMVDAVMRFTVTNTGNAVQDFLLTAVNTSPNPFGLPADNFDPLPGTVQVFVEGGAEPGNGYLPSQDTGIYIDELMPNESRTVYVVSDLPTLSIDDVSAIALIAQIAEGGAIGVEGVAINADDNGNVSPAGIFSNGATNVPAGTPNTIPDSVSTMETVFNDPAGLDPEDVSTDLNQDVVSNGQHSDAGAYQVMSPVSIIKSVTVIDTLGGADPHPGATLRYQLDVSVAGNTAVDNLIISDSIPANTTYTDGSILLNGIVQTDANDVPTDYSRAIDILSKPVVSIEVDLSRGGSVSVAPGETNIIIFEVTID